MMLYLAELAIPNVGRVKERERRARREMNLAESIFWFFCRADLEEVTAIADEEHQDCHEYETL